MARQALEKEPGVGLQALLTPVPVVVEQLRLGLDVLLGHDDEARSLADHHHLGGAVRALGAVVEEPAIAPALPRRVDAILVALVLEIIHVATLRTVHRILGLEVLGVI